MRLYVAHPIDQLTATSQTSKWRKLVADLPALVRQSGDVVAFFPGRAFVVSKGARIDYGLERINRAALDLCEGVLAVLPSGQATIGVPREIESAKKAGKPVAVVSDLEGSFSLADVPIWPIDEAGVLGALEWLQAQPRGMSGSLPFQVGQYGRLPTRTYDGDAGFDLYVSKSCEIEPGTFVDVPTDVYCALPPGVWGRITGRSSTLRRRGMLVAEGIIDNGYRGELFIGIWNLSDRAVVAARGERLAQLILHDNTSARFEAEEVPETFFAAIPGDGRGAGGFGSTGV